MPSPTTPPAGDSNPRAETLLQGKPIEDRVIPLPSSKIGQGLEHPGVGPELKSEIGMAWAKDSISQNRIPRKRSP